MKNNKSETKKRTLFPIPYSLSPHQGFTLIELLTTISVMAIITTFSIASFSSYNDSQTLQTTTAGIVDTLNIAKSRALSQIVDAQCTNKTLSGYQVSFALPNQYTLQVFCDGTIYPLTQTRTLAKNITFKSGTAASILFNAGTGIVANRGSVVITGYGNTKTISVSETGTISVQ